MKLYWFEGLKGEFDSINVFVIAKSVVDAQKKIIKKYINDVSPVFGIKTQKDKKYLDKKINDFKDSFGTAFVQEFELNESVCEFVYGYDNIS